MNDQEELMAGYNTQVDLMERLGDIKCVFCLLNSNPNATHRTEQCRITQISMRYDDIYQFSEAVKDWGRNMPFNRNSDIRYCGFCRFPQVEQFHYDGNSRGSCRYNDFMNRTAWALRHNSKFHPLVYKYSNHSINPDQINDNVFKSWLLQESSTGVTHLFRIFALIVDRGEDPPSLFFLNQISDDPIRKRNSDLWFPVKIDCLAMRHIVFSEHENVYHRKPVPGSCQCVTQIFLFIVLIFSFPMYSPGIEIRCTILSWLTHFPNIS
jgi:hypothetical protein